MPHLGRLAAGRFSSEKRLAQRAAAGDAGAFAAIFERYHQPIYRYCLSILHDPDVLILDEVGVGDDFPPREYEVCPMFTRENTPQGRDRVPGAIPRNDSDEPRACWPYQTHHELPAGG